jgi:hypothetical protein
MSLAHALSQCEDIPALAALIAVQYGAGEDTEALSVLLTASPPILAVMADNETVSLRLAGRMGRSASEAPVAEAFPRWYTVQHHSIGSVRWCLMPVEEPA